LHFGGFVNERQADWNALLRRNS